MHVFFLSHSNSQVLSPPLFRQPSKTERSTGSRSDLVAPFELCNLEQEKEANTFPIPKEMFPSSSRHGEFLSTTAAAGIRVETTVTTPTTTSVVGARSSSILGACGRISRCIGRTRRRGSVTTTTPSAASSTAKATARGESAIVAARATVAALVGGGHVVVHAFPAGGGARGLEAVAAVGHCGCGGHVTTLLLLCLAFVLLLFEGELFLGVVSGALTGSAVHRGHGVVGGCWAT
jgi:hypothetical protein